MYSCREYRDFSRHLADISPEVFPETFPHRALEKFFPEEVISTDRGVSRRLAASSPKEPIFAHYASGYFCASVLDRYRLARGYGAPLYAVDCSLMRFICFPQQISECGMLSGQGQGFS